MHDGHEHHHHEEHTSQEEMTALLKYLVKHNTEHTKELTDLASHLDMSERAKALVASAAADYEAGNKKLAEALSALTEG